MFLPWRAFTSATEPSRIFSPRLMRATRSHSRSTVSIWWLESTMVVPCAPQVEHHLAHHVHAHGVEAAHRLVQDQHLGLVQHGGDELRLLLHALRELVRLASCASRRARAARARGRAASRASFAAHALDRGHEHELLLEHHARVEPALLGHVADAVAGGVVGGLAQDLDRPGVGAEDVHDHAQRGGLAGAVRARAGRRRCSRGTSRDRSFTATWPAKALRMPLRTMALSFMEPPRGQAVRAPGAIA